MPLRLLPKGATVAVLQGPLRGARWTIGALNHGCWLGSFEIARQRAFVRLARAGDCVYDIGANVGFYSLLAARLVGPTGRVIAIEPLPRNLEDLRRHLVLNHVSNVTVVAAAVMDRDGTVRMHVPSPSEAYVDAAGSGDVRAVRLDDLVYRDGYPSPNLLKIDVEGAELPVLLGARRVLLEARPTILLSTHSEALRRSCQALLTASGYRLQPETPGAELASCDDVIASPSDETD